MTNAARARVWRLDHTGDFTEFRVHAGLNDHGPATPIGGRGAGMYHIFAIADRRLPIERGHVFFYRNGFARKGSLLDLQVDGLKQPRISWNFVPGAQEKHVARHEVACRQFSFFAVSYDVGRRCGHLTQGLNRTFSTVFLHKAQYNREKYDDGDRNGLDGMPQKCGGHRCSYEDQYEDVFELL